MQGWRLAKGASGEKPRDPDGCWKVQLPSPSLLPMTSSAAVSTPTVGLFEQ